MQPSVRSEAEFKSGTAEKQAVLHRTFYYQWRGPMGLYSFLVPSMRRVSEWNYDASVEFIKLANSLEACANGHGTDAQCQRILDKYDRYVDATARDMQFSDY